MKIQKLRRMRRNEDEGREKDRSLKRKLRKDSPGWMFPSGMFNLPLGWLLPFIEATHILSRKEFSGARRGWSYEL